MNNRPRGARPSPRHKAFATPSFQPPVSLLALPASFGMVPKTLSMLGNDTYGCCVTSEEAAAKEAYSVMGGGPELVFSDQTAIAWARLHGFLNGAVITEVMDAMARYGMPGSDGRTYTDGPYHSVDWTNDAVLSSAIYQGPVKIGVAADQLENAVRDSNGWLGTGFTRDPNIDHCVGLWGYGTVQDLYRILGVAMPGNANPMARGYLLYTWSTIGVITQASMIAITGEAWLRTPTTPEAPQPAPTPAPTPTPVPPAPSPTPVPVPPAPQPLPTPPPTPHGINAMAWDDTTKRIMIPSGFTTNYKTGPTIIIHPNIRQVNIPPGVDGVMIAWTWILPTAANAALVVAAMIVAAGLVVIAVAAYATWRMD